MGFFDFFKPRPKPTPNLGANLDTRSEPEKAGDILVSQVVASPAAVEWRTLQPSEVRQFGVQNQGQKGSCVAESRRKIKRIMLKVNRGLDLDFSSAAFYRQRVNFPSAGMQAWDAIRMDKDRGMTLDALVPSDAVRDEMEASLLKVEPFNKDVAKVFAVEGDDVVFENGDLLTPAGTIQKTRKGVMMWFFFTAEEWSREVPVVLDKSLRVYDARALRHSVVGVEPALYYKGEHLGKRGVWIDDSAHFGGLSRRFITEEFYRERNFWASYPHTFKFEKGVGTRPRYTGVIVSAQECLRYEGLFPANVDYVDNLGPLTRRGLGDFQARYGLKKTQVLDAATDKELRRLYP